MGWCSGTVIFDDMVEALLEDVSISDITKERIIRRLIVILTDNDWDCQADSRYYNNDLVQKCFNDLR